VEIEDFVSILFRCGGGLITTLGLLRSFPAMAFVFSNSSFATDIFIPFIFWEIF
jgi:hypothetical protein